MPTDPDIDHKGPIRGAMPLYTHHILINTPRDDWDSRIEDEYDGDNMAKQIKKLTGVGGKLYDPRRNILTSNSSLGNSRYPGQQCLSVFPNSQNIEPVNNRNLSSVLQSLFDPESEPPVLPEERITPTILICGHKSRDERCGILGPLLRQEFQNSIQRYVDDDSIRLKPQIALSMLLFSVGLVSHIGGHKWAGNVIIYFPPGYEMEDGQPCPLAGKGVWYGRVGPQHVEGIMNETVRKGNVIEELLRGVHEG